MNENDMIKLWVDYIQNRISSLETIILAINAGIIAWTSIIITVLYFTYENLGDKAIGVIGIILMIFALIVIDFFGNKSVKKIKCYRNSLLDLVWRVLFKKITSYKDIASRYKKIYRNYHGKSLGSSSDPQKKE